MSHGERSVTDNVDMSHPSDDVRPLLKTRQYREFNEVPITDEQLDALLKVARWSGSAGNSQPCRFIVIRDIAALRQLAELGHPQTRSLNTATAAIAITLPDDEGRETVHAYDEGRVAERLLIGATMLGLGAGIAWVRPENRERIGGALEVEEGRYVRTIMAVGRPSEQARQPRSAAGEARLPLDELVKFA
jgi:nitroreductase